MKKRKNQKVKHQKDLSVDLAFIPPPKEILVEFSHLIRNDILLDSKQWQEYIKIWLEVIKEEKKDLCPEILLRSSSISLGLQFTNDITIADLNSTWRKQNQPTDVLSFPALDNQFFYNPSEYSIEIGDIIVSIPTAVRQAQQNDHSPQKELRWLVSHGLLHLLGWDHPNENKLEEMLKFQEHLLSIDGNLPCQGGIT